MGEAVGRDVRGFVFDGFIGGHGSERGDQRTRSIGIGAEIFRLRPGATCRWLC